MVLAGDKYLASPLIADRVVDTMMPEFHFVNFCTECLRNQLMPEANAKQWQPANKFPDCLNLIVERLGVSGAV